MRRILLGWFVVDIDVDKLVVLGLRGVIDGEIVVGGEWRDFTKRGGIVICHVILADFHGDLDRAELSDIRAFLPLSLRLVGLKLKLLPIELFINPFVTKRILPSHICWFIHDFMLIFFLHFWIYIVVLLWLLLSSWWRFYLWYGWWNVARRVVIIVRNLGVDCRTGINWRLFVVP